MNIVIKCDCGNKITIPAQRVNTLNLEIIWKQNSFILAKPKLKMES